MQTTISRELIPHAGGISSSPEDSVEKGDLRHFIRLLADTGQLLRVKGEIDWKFDVGRMTRDNRTALLFENIKGYPQQRVFTNGLRDPRSIALALGLDRETSWNTLIREAKKRIHSPIKPLVVTTGPVLENIVAASEVDLRKLPVPHWSEFDGGRYLGTWHINVGNDPETGSRNVGVYRMQLLGPKQATVSASPRSHLAQQIAKAEKGGQPLPMAVAIGVSETVIMAAAAAYPDAMDEYDLAGGLQQEAVRLVPCQTVNLQVPANSEIVIEGFIQPGIRMQDGPYFDYTGTVNTNANAFLFEASQLMFRSNPIFRGTSIGVPGAEDHQLFAVLAQRGHVDFHGSRVKQKVQNHALKERWFQTFQLLGKLGAAVRGKGGAARLPNDQRD